MMSLGSLHQEYLIICCSHLEVDGRLSGQRKTLALNSLSSSSC